MARTAYAVVAIMVILAGCTTTQPTGGEDRPGESPDHPLQQLATQLANGTIVTFTTSKGTIEVLLFDELMPVTTARFLELVDQGFHNGTSFHRIVDDFVIQAGDPSGTGLLGSGETIPLEYHELLQYGAGGLGMARDVDPDSADSQWFITEKPAPHLHNPGSIYGTYAMFCQVIDEDSLVTVHDIASTPVVPGADRPVEEVTVEAIERTPTALTSYLAVLQTTYPITGSIAGDLQVPMFPETGISHQFRFYAEETDGPETIAVTVAAEGQPEEERQLLKQSYEDKTYRMMLDFPSPGKWTITIDGQDIELDVMPQAPAARQ